jgi:hypothetical protein
MEPSEAGCIIMGIEWEGKMPLKAVGDWRIIGFTS